MLISKLEMSRRATHESQTTTMPALINKTQRFTVLSRDNFTCRYCGRKSDLVPLQVDHVIPRCRGGGNELTNLVTACRDCNIGKGINTPDMAKELKAEFDAYKSFAEVVNARNELKSAIECYWWGRTGGEKPHKQTVFTVTNYAVKFGVETVLAWIDLAAVKCDNDIDMGRYISGIRRNFVTENDKERA